MLIPEDTEVAMETEAKRRPAKPKAAAARNEFRTVMLEDLFAMGLIAILLAMIIPVRD